MSDQHEPCNCGAPVRVHFGPDIRFDPPCSKPMMYRAECSGDCINPSFTSFTKERALELWDERMRKNRADDRAASPLPPGDSATPEGREPT